MSLAGHLPSLDTCFPRQDGSGQLGRAQVRAPPPRRGHLGSSLPLSTLVGTQATHHPAPPCLELTTPPSQKQMRLLSRAPPAPPLPQGEGQGLGILPGIRTLVPKHSKFLLLPAGPEARLGRGGQGGGRAVPLPAPEPGRPGVPSGARGPLAGPSGVSLKPAAAAHTDPGPGPGSRPRTLGAAVPGGVWGASPAAESARGRAPGGAGRPACPRFLPRSRPLGAGAGDEGRDGGGGAPPAPRPQFPITRLAGPGLDAPPGLPRRPVSLPPTPRRASRPNSTRSLALRRWAAPPPAPARGGPGSRPPGGAEGAGVPRARARARGPGAGGRRAQEVPLSPPACVPGAVNPSGPCLGVGRGERVWSWGTPRRAEPRRAGRGRAYVSGAGADRRPPAAEAGTAAAAGTGPERAWGPRPRGAGARGRPDPSSASPLPPPRTGEAPARWWKSAPAARPLRLPGAPQRPRALSPRAGPHRGPESLQGDARPGPSCSLWAPCTPLPPPPRWLGDTVTALAGEWGAGLGRCGHWRPQHPWKATWWPVSLSCLSLSPLELAPPAAGTHCHQDVDPLSTHPASPPSCPPSWDPTYLTPQSTSRPSPHPQLLGLLPPPFSAIAQSRPSPPTPGLMFPPPLHSDFSEPPGRELIRGPHVPPTLTRASTQRPSHLHFCSTFALLPGPAGGLLFKRGAH